MAAFDWDRRNLKKIRAHKIKVAEAEQTLSRAPILIYAKEADSEARFVYYGETEGNRLLAIVLMERESKIRVITAYDLDATKQTRKIPGFEGEDEEAKWWASREGRAFIKRQSAAISSRKQKGSALVTNLNGAASVQMALRLPAPDLAKARQIAGRKGIGYQTLLKMLVHEGLHREARRQ